LSFHKKIQDVLVPIQCKTGVVYCLHFRLNTHLVPRKLK
jgi:hypothetical protein